MEAYNQSRKALINRERKMDIRKNPSIKTTIIINVTNVTVGNKIPALDVDRRIISSQIVQKRKLQIRKFTGARKSLKLVRTG